MPLLTFPDGFQWGAATAAYQIEGAYREDDRGLSIWDTFAHQPGTIQDGATGDVACDHYHRYQEDVDLMAAIGLQTYRFSVSWSRVMPFGKGAVNEKGLAFYDRLIDALLAKNIEPMLTLYHWDLPQSLQDLGGWANRSIADWFAGYADLMFERYGDRVKKWVTLNEPYIFTDIGHRRGVMAPGIKDLAIYGRAIHHAHLAHGRAVQAFRASGKGGEIGITNANSSYEAADDTPETAEAVELARDFDSRLFHGPVFGKGYPQSVLNYHDARNASLPIEDGDMEIIASPTDFLGVNLYSRSLIQASPGRGVGFAWASILSLPYALLSDSVPAQKMGVYMGIFNFFIVIPQLVAVATLGYILKHLFADDPSKILIMGGVSMLVAGLCVLRVPEPAAHAA